MKILGTLSLFLYRLGIRVRSKLFSVLVSGAFAGFGRQSTIIYPLRVSGERRIRIGDRVFIGAGSWLQTLPDPGNSSVALSIGNGTSIAGNCVISAVRSIKLGEEVLLARNVYISDHIHKYTGRNTSILDQGLDKIRPVVIERGAWLGQNVVVCPGVRIGEGAVIGANSVVTKDVPDRCIAAGSPARVVKMIEEEVSYT